MRALKLKDMQMSFSREDFRNQLLKKRRQNDHRLMERSVLALYALQTDDERAVSHTRRDNNRGFSKKTDRKGSYLARWLLRGNRLTGRYIEQGYRVCHEHAGQLARVANGNKNLRSIVDVTLNGWNRQLHPALKREINL